MFNNTRPFGPAFCGSAFFFYFSRPCLQQVVQSTTDLSDLSLILSSTPKHSIRKLSKQILNYRKSKVETDNEIK